MAKERYFSWPTVSQISNLIDCPRSGKSMVLEVNWALNEVSRWGSNLCVVNWDIILVLPTPDSPKRTTFIDYGSFIYFIFYY